MATTPNTGVTLLESSQSQKEITVNEALYRMDALINSRVLDKDLASPPANPNEGDSYIVASAATGDWAGHEGEVAYFHQIWRFITPKAGLVFWVADEQAFYVYSGTEWAMQTSASAVGRTCKNALQNGDFELWQRGSSYHQFAMQYGADRWIMHRAAPGNVEIRRETITDLPRFRRAMRIARNAGDTVLHPIHVEQTIETVNAVRLQGQALSLSFYVKMGAEFEASQFTVQLLSGTGIDELALNGGFTGEQILHNAALAHTSQWQRVSIAVTAPNNATQFAVRFRYAPTAIAGANDWVQLTGVQLEAAESATEFEFISYASALFRAQRYYEKSFPPDVTPIRDSGDTANAARVPQLVGAVAGMYSAIAFLVEKRGAPSITFYNPSANNAQMRNFVNNQNCTSTTALFIGTKGMAPFCVTPSGSSAGQQLLVHYSADAELY